MADFEMVLSLIGGTKKINLHASYAVTGGKTVERCALESRHFDAWVDLQNVTALASILTHIF